MAKSKAQFICHECKAVHNKWAGKCDACGAWNSLTEEAPVETTPKGLSASKGRRIQFVTLEGQEKHPPRRMTGIGELDRVLGGGLVAGSAILVGGDPGIG
ncbi:MAG: DNA repair protein RadA, partial [Phycisphaeraceae bacterium]|nr:DNA repair protein RadA [Phycisphaeraceae bacterium]